MNNILFRKICLMCFLCKILCTNEHSWRFKSTDFSKCVCSVCDVNTSVGRVLNDKCFYISIFDRVFYNNDYVPSLSKSLINDVDILDGLISCLRNDFVKAFPKSSLSVNLKPYSGSNLYQSPSGNIRCTKLNMSSNALFDDSQRNCKPEPNIIFTSAFEILPTIKNAKTLNNSLENEVLSVPSRPSFNAANLKECRNKKDGFLTNRDICIFFSQSDSTSCILAEILDTDTYVKFESFVVNLVEEKTLHECSSSGDDAELMQCKINSFRKVYRSFIVYFNPQCTKSLNSTYFNINGTIEGYYFVDVPRKRMNYLNSYFEGITYLINTYGSKSTKHFCQEENIPIVTTPEHTTTVQFTQDFTINTDSTSKLSVNKTDSGPVQYHQKANHTVIYVCLGVFTLIVLCIVLYIQFGRATCSFRE